MEIARGCRARDRRGRKSLLMCIYLKTRWSSLINLLNTCLWLHIVYLILLILSAEVHRSSLFAVLSFIIREFLAHHWALRVYVCRNQGQYASDLNNLADLEGDSLTMYGPQSLEALDRNWGVQAAGAVTHVLFKFIDFDEIAKHLHKIRTRFPGVQVRASLFTVKVLWVSQWVKARPIELGVDLQVFIYWKHFI